MVAASFSFFSAGKPLPRALGQLRLEVVVQELQLGLGFRASIVSGMKVGAFLYRGCS